MLDALNFVKGAVAKKDYQPALTHFRIAEGRILGYNGVIALCSPIDLEIEAMPEALPFVRAIERCTGKTTVVHMTEGGRLSLKSGRFQAYVNCHDDSEVLDRVTPEGAGAELSGNVLNAFRALQRFVGDDASRPWSNGILLRGQSAFATNNVILAEYWIGSALPEVNVPASAIKELLRIGEEPVAASIGEQSITFHFEGDRWLRSQLLSTEWPDLSRVLDKDYAPKPFPEGLFDAVETLVPFVDLTGRIFFRGDHLTTSAAGGKEGAAVEIADIPQAGAFHHKHLLSLQGVATSIDFSAYPNPCGFYGEGMRGAIVGMRDA